MNKKASKNLIFLALILLLGFSVRFYRLSSNPAGFFCDEAANGFNAYTLSEKGTDEYSVPYPFFFRSFGDYRNPVTIYSTIPFVKLFGLREFSVRVVNIIYGTLTIITVFLLVKNLFNQTAALFSALLLAISPWHIHFSRTGFEFIPFPFYFSLALLLFLKGLKKHGLLIPSAISWGLAFYTYYPSQLITPLTLVFLILIYHREIRSVRKEVIALSLMITIVWFLPFLIGVEQGTILTRFKSVSVFEVQPLPQVVRSMFLSFFNHFSPSFLFTKGDIGFPGHFVTRHSIRGTGELYLFQLPLIIVGIYWLIRKVSRKKVLLVLLWVLIYPLGSIFTENGPYAHRSIIGVIPFQILSGTAVSCLINLSNRQTWLKKLIMPLLLVLITSFSFANYVPLYFNQYPLYSSDFWGWQFGPKEIMKYFLTVKDSYDDLYMSGEFNGASIFLKFYDPENTCQSKCKLGDLWRDPQIYNPARRQLFSLSPEYLHDSKFEGAFLTKQVIHYPNGKVAFLIGEVAFGQSEESLEAVL